VVGELGPLAGVDRLDGADEVGEDVHAQLVGADRESGDVLGQAAATEAESGIEELPPDPLVVADRVGQQGHVPAGRLAHLSHRIDEADLGRQERVRGDLDQLGGGDVTSHDRGPFGERDLVDLLQGRQCPLGMGTEDEPVRAQSVLDGVRLAQELRVPGDLDGIAGGRLGPEPFLQRHGGADRNRRLADDQARLRQQRCQRVDRRVQL